MDVKKCDRCGEVYDPKDETYRVFRILKWEDYDKRSDGHICMPDGCVDLCKGCYKKLNNFLIGKD